MWMTLYSLCCIISLFVFLSEQEGEFDLQTTKGLRIIILVFKNFMYLLFYYIPQWLENHNHKVRDMV